MKYVLLLLTALFAGSVAAKDRYDCSKGRHQCWSETAVRLLEVSTPDHLITNKTAFQMLSKQAKDRNCNVSMRWLAYCYYNGIGVSKDFRKALKWYSKAEKAGDKVAKAEMEQYRETGRFTEKASMKVPEDLPYNSTLWIDGF